MTDASASNPTPNDAVPDSEKETKELVELAEALRDIGSQESPNAGQMMMKWYGELRNIAAAQLRQESSSHTLQPTALVHEAFFTPRSAAIARTKISKRNARNRRPPDAQGSR